MGKFQRDSIQFQKNEVTSIRLKPRFRKKSVFKKRRRQECRKHRRTLLNSLKDFGKPIKENFQFIKEKQNAYALTPEQKEVYISLLKERKKNVLKLRVKLSLEDPGLNLGKEYANKSISVDDIRLLITYFQHHHHVIGGAPQWIKLTNFDLTLFSVVLIVEGVGKKEWTEAVQETCPSLAAAAFKIPFDSPVQYGGDIISELCTIPLTKTQLNNLSRRYSTIQKASQDKKSSDKLLSTMFQIKRHPKKEVKNKDEENDMKIDPSNLRQADRVSNWRNDKFPRTMLLLTPWQMVQSNFPMPIEDTPFEGYVKTKEVYERATDQSPMYGLDCEMCQTTKGSELTRVSLINENHEIIYERLVKPYNRITNYLTKFSGITKSMLEHVDTRLEQVQSELIQLLPPDAILIGQSLEIDLQALKMVHPFVIDTSVIFNLSGDRNRKTGLRILVQEFLSERIQEAGKLGHDSIEDAISALKLVQAKLQNYFEWGNKLLDGERNPDEVAAARLLLEQRDEVKKEEFVRKYATINICDEYVPHAAVNCNGKVKKHNPPDTFNKRWNVTEHDPSYFQATSTIENLTHWHKKLVLVGQNSILDEYAEFISPEMEVVPVEKMKPGDWNREKKILFRSTAKSNKGVVSSMCNVPSLGSGPRTTVWGHTRLKDGNIRRVSKWLRMLKKSFPMDTTIFTLVLTGNKESEGLCMMDVNSLPPKTNEELKDLAIAAAPHDDSSIKTECW